MYRLFRKDPFFLQRYTVISSITLILLCGVLSIWSTTLWPWTLIAVLFAHSSFRSVLLAWGIAIVLYFLTVETVSWMAIVGCVALGVFVGLWSNVLIHNASHEMIKPLWLNRIIGELTGLQVLSGFPGFAILHMEHHIHSDHEDLDPHPNLPGQTFWQYIDGTRARLRQTFSQLYQRTWQGRPELMNSWKHIKLLLPLNRALRAIILFKLLGPMGGTFFFITSHVTTQLAFAVINFYSHERQVDGTVQIRNLDHNWIFWILNRTFSGAFYHRNHHQSPKLFNPMKMRGTRGSI